MDNPAGNWYPDPTGRHELRYWDGAGWTAHVVSQGLGAIDPIAAEQPSATATERGGTHRIGRELTPTSSASIVAEVEVSPQAGHSRRAQKRAGRNEFETVALAAAKGDRGSLETLPAIAESARKYFRGKKFDEKTCDVFALAIRDVLAEDSLTADEEQHLLDLARALGIDFAYIADHDFGLFEELFIARINDGRLPSIDGTPIVRKPGEIVHYVQDVALMKEVAVRQMRGGSSGVTIHLARGVSYRVGQVRAHSEVVGSEMQVQDTGQLVITSQHAVFLGQRRTLEFRYDKLAGVEQFRDGLRLNVSNRQLASLFRFPPKSSPSIAAALIARASTTSRPS